MLWLIIVGYLSFTTNLLGFVVLFSKKNPILCGLRLFGNAQILCFREVRILLTKFSVENFKNFEKKVTWDLLKTNNYEFNSDIIVNGCITKGLIYGPNGSGKSNLGLALFDIIFHLTDKQKLYEKYDYYLNLNSKKHYAEFEYVFNFDGIELVYEYKKEDVDTLLEEKLSISGNEMVYFDYTKNSGRICLAGAETLNLTGETSLSRIKYIKSNAILENNPTNNAFVKFVDFVDRMLLFYSLDSRGYQGLSIGSEGISNGIIESKKTHEFQEFLKNQGIEYNLIEAEEGKKKYLYCQYENDSANLFSVASTGTISLAVFYYWYIKMKSASLVFVDEFDAFYHFELAENIVKMLRELDNQIFLSTHNTDLMNNDLLRPDCYFFINESRIKAIPELTEREIRQAHNLQKMYKAGVFR